MGNSASSFPDSACSHSRSRFFDLPLELREQIYEWALPASILKATNTDDKTWPVFYKSARGPLPYHLYDWRPGNLGLLQVNRQINEEASLVFYRSNVFNVVITDGQPQFAIRYIWETPRTRAFTHSPLFRRPSKVDTSTIQAVTRYHNVIELQPCHLLNIRHLYIVIARNDPEKVNKALHALEAQARDIRDPIGRGMHLKRLEGKRARLQYSVLRDGLETLRRSFNPTEASVQRRRRHASTVKPNRSYRSGHLGSLRNVEVVLYPRRLSSRFDSFGVRTDIIYAMRRLLPGMLAVDGKWSIKALDARFEGWTAKYFFVRKFDRMVEGRLSEWDYDMDTTKLRKIT